MTIKAIKAKKVLVIVDSNVVGVVEGFATEFIREGGIEPHYNSETGKHAIGTRHATFSIRRWMYVDTKKKLLFDLMNDKKSFNLEFGITDMEDTPDFVTGTKLVLTDCVGYTWKPVTGAANDIVAEELVGEAIDWIDTDFTD